MADDPFSAGLAQFAQAWALPWRLFSKPQSDAVRVGLRRRNVMLDALFYDVRVVARDEASDLAQASAGEGAILVVPPSGAGRIAVCASIDDYFARGGGAIATLTVAGVGSSALGTAAFARNVADAVGAPVAAVVSGYGLADLATEAAGGFFWFSGLTAMHDLRETLDRSLGAARAAEAKGPPGASAHADHDTDVVLALIKDERAPIDLIVAHSKGNLVVCDALHALQRDDRALSDRTGETVHVVSISSRLRMPRGCRKLTEIVGRWDLVGDFATRRDAPPDVVVPDAWHHTNTDLYGHLPVTKVLREVLGKGA
jgi:hypothetical protein